MDSPTPPDSSAVFKAPAKVNLFLRVLSRRPDGYHEIYSLMQPVSLYDEVAIGVRTGSTVSVASSGQAPSGPENLAYKAAVLFLERAGLKRAVDISIEKAIPVGAGLGGGSSDAATVLMGLNTLLNAGLDDAALMDIGAAIGSDVPFFMLKGPAVARGRGERLRPLRLPAYAYLLVNPGYMVSTAWAYGNLDLTKVYKDNILTYSDDSFMEIGKLKGCVSNDLERPTIGRYPGVAELKGLLMEAGAEAALMSGSGPTVFGLFSGPAARDGALRRIREKLDRGHFIAPVDGLTG